MAFVMDLWIVFFHRLFLVLSVELPQPLNSNEHWFFVRELDDHDYHLIFVSENSTILFSSLWRGVCLGCDKAFIDMT